MIHPKILLMVAALSSCLLIGISCGQTDDRSLQDSIFTPIGSSVLESQASGVAELARCKDFPTKCDECPFSPFYAIWTLNKYGSQRLFLNDAARIRDQIESIRSHEGDVVQIPVQD